jgi:hypothetical protein
MLESSGCDLNSAVRALEEIYDITHGMTHMVCGGSHPAPERVVFAELPEEIIERCRW